MPWFGTDPMGAVSDLITSTWPMVIADGKPQDQIFDTNVLLAMLRLGEKRGNRRVPQFRSAIEEQAGGEHIGVNLLTQTNSTVGSFAPYQLLDVTPQDLTGYAYWNWKSVAGSVTFSGRELRVNQSSPQRIYNLMEEKRDQAIMSLEEELEDELMSDGTGNGGLDFTGIAAMIDSTPLAGTYAGINRATYTWWQPQAEAAVGSFAANGAAALRSLWRACTWNNIAPDFHLTTGDIYDYYEVMLEPSVRRVQDEELASLGFDNLAYKGGPVVWSRQVTAGEWKMISSKLIKLVLMKGANFARTEMVKPSNQDAMTGQIIVEGNLTTKASRNHGTALGITA
jgi:hypothetical protein